MFKYQDYNNKCWWCGKSADSMEHKFKKSDTTREFGDGPYNSDVVRIANKDIGKSEKNIQGPKSKVLKFSRVLCSDCNNNRSSKFDISYDKFMTFLKSEEDVIYKTHSIDLVDVFGENWKIGIENVTKYIVKHIACRLAENRIEVIQEFIVYLNGGVAPKFLKLLLLIRSDKADFVQLLKKNNEDDGYISIPPLFGTFFQKRNEWENLYSSYDYRGFSFMYRYDKSIKIFQTNLKDRIIHLKK